MLSSFHVYVFNSYHNRSFVDKSQNFRGTVKQQNSHACQQRADHALIFTSAHTCLPSNQINVRRLSSTIRYKCLYAKKCINAVTLSSHHQHKPSLQSDQRFSQLLLDACKRTSQPTFFLKIWALYFWENELYWLQLTKPLHKYHKLC